MAQPPTKSDLPVKPDLPTISIVLDRELYYNDEEQSCQNIVVQQLFVYLSSSTISLAFLEEIDLERNKNGINIIKPKSNLKEDDRLPHHVTIPAKDAIAILVIKAERKMIKLSSNDFYAVGISAVGMEFSTIEQLIDNLFREKQKGWKIFFVDNKEIYEEMLPSFA